MNKLFRPQGIILKTFFDGKLVSNLRTFKKRRFYSYIQREKLKNCTFYLKVTYGGGFCNEGEYKTKKELIHAFKAFTEE